MASPSHVDEELEQQNWIPREPLDVEIQQIDIDLITEDLVGPPPRPGVIESMKAWGFWKHDPILVTEKPDGTYHVVDGRRRVKAARKARIEYIWAAVCSNPQGATDSALLTVASEALRGPNLAARVQAVEYLRQDRGLSDEQIAHATGLNKKDLQNKIVPLLSLAPSLREAFDAGGIAEGVALAAARLPADQQEELSHYLAETGRVTHANVREVKALFEQGQSDAEPAFWNLDEVVPQEPKEDDKDKLIATLRDQLRASEERLAAPAGAIDIPLLDHLRLCLSKWPTYELSGYKASKLLMERVISYVTEAEANPNVQRERREAEEQAKVASSPAMQKLAALMKKTEPEVAETDSVTEELTAPTDEASLEPAFNPADEAARAILAERQAAKSRPQATELPPVPYEEEALVPRQAQGQCSFCSGSGQVALENALTQKLEMVQCIACDGTGVEVS